MLDISPEFFDLGFKSVTPDKAGEIATKGKFTSRLTYKSKINLLLNLYYINNGKQEIRWDICSANFQSTYVDITCNLRQVGKYKFNIWADINGVRTFLFAYNLNYTN